jgi:glycosyltransferase involved in cell wall biosynthesis
MSEPRVLVLHNRYRVHGGEERAVELHLAALLAAGVNHRALMRDSAQAGRARAAAGLLAGGAESSEIARATRELGATVVHAHNLQPLLGPRALQAARHAGARTVLHLHNFRLFCAIGVAYRNGEPCFRCHHGRTLPGLVLNCRGSLPEAAVYAVALRRQLPWMLDVVDRFVTPSAYLAGQIVGLGVPAERVEAIPHYLPSGSFAETSVAHRGRFALVVGRLSAEKGMEVAIDAAVAAGVPLKVAGAGPREADLRALALRLGGQVEFLGRVTGDQLSMLRREAAVVLVPSNSDETFGLTALEAMGAGVPVVATGAGALPELVGEERCVPRADGAAMAARLADLWADPERRRAEGDALIARARERYSAERFTRELVDLYARLGRS